MLPKIVVLVICTFFLMEAHCRNLKSDTSSEEENKVLESLKEFVRMVDRYQLNVTIIGTQKEFHSNGKIKEDNSISIHMPVNNVHLTRANFDKQNKYIKKIQKVAKKEKVGLRNRIIQIENGENQEADVYDVNKNYVITSPAYNLLTTVKNGVQGFSLPENVTQCKLYNYVINNPNEKVKNVEVIVVDEVIETYEVSDDFPQNVLDETKKILPQLENSIQDKQLLARLLVEHLDKKFQGQHQVIIDTNGFSLAGKKYAFLRPASFNMVVFVL